MIARFFFFPFSTRLWKEFPCRCTPFCVRPILWITWNENYAISLPFCYCQMRTQVGAKYENKTHANDTHFCQLFLRSFFLPFILAGSFLSRQKKELKKQTKKVDRISTFFIGFISFFHHTITVTMDDRTHTACPIRNVLRVANGQKWCNKWQCVVLVTLVRRLTTTCRHTFVLSFPLSLCGTKKKLSTVARHT